MILHCQVLQKSAESLRGSCFPENHWTVEVAVPKYRLITSKRPLSKCGEQSIGIKDDSRNSFFLKRKFWAQENCRMQQILCHWGAKLFVWAVPAGGPPSCCYELLCVWCPQEKPNHLTDKFVPRSFVSANHIERRNQLPNQQPQFHQPHVRSITNQRVHTHTRMHRPLKATSAEIQAAGGKSDEKLWPSISPLNHTETLASGNLSQLKQSHAFMKPQRRSETNLRARLVLGPGYSFTAQKTTAQRCFSPWYLA